MWVAESDSDIWCEEIKIRDTNVRVGLGVDIIVVYCVRIQSPERNFQTF